VASATDWRQIVQLYDQLVAIAPGPVVALNRAVAVAETSGAVTALALVDRLQLTEFYLFHAVRADLLQRLGRSSEAKAAYRAALGRVTNARERAFLEDRLRAMSDWLP